ncbi:FHA domain-containing protein [Paraburkholderia adhaesiva]|uniref:FHA domain-containing protein n=1 Tax=Paraburkholderia adhaesiva TaxID=2883244 RepID=UPI001F3F880D|nr:FHA domain-containing protein [Paraburkholderia adhaesiva]
MSAGGIITVTGGIHAGASVLLSDGHDMMIGNEDDANIVLVDESIVAHHATICLNGNLLKLTAHHDGVRVFGHALAPGKTTVLRQGASFTVGDAQIQFSGRDLLTPDEVRSAELAWLMAHAPVAYVAKRWALTSRGVKLTLMIALISAAAGVMWQMYGPHDVGSEAPKLDGAFRFVTVREDPKTHAYVYDGYVSTARDLSSLAAIVRRDTCASVMRVVVVDQMKEQVADFLTRYYRGAQIKAGAPGTFTIIPPAEEGYLLPESWDYARVARLAYESINGLRELAFEGHAENTSPVRAPIGAIGMNLARSAHGSWLVDAQGVRYFAGAQLALGKITDISGCTVTIVRNDDGTPYVLSAQTGKDNKKCN